MILKIKVLLAAACISALCIPATKASCNTFQVNGFLPSTSPTFPATNLQDCKQSCLESPDCALFYYDANSVTCYYTNDITQLENDPIIISYQKLCDSCTIEAVSGYLPTTANQIPSSSLELCGWQCDFIQSCKVFYFDSWRSICYWSNDIAQLISDISKTSYFTHCPPLCSFVGAPATDVVSAQAFGSGNLDDCKYQCSIFESCVYLVFESNTCYFGTNMANIVLGNSATSYTHYIKQCVDFPGNGNHNGIIKNGNQGKHLGQLLNGNNGNNGK